MRRRLTTPPIRTRRLYRPPHKFTPIPLDIRRPSLEILEGFSSPNKMALDRARSILSGITGAPDSYDDRKQCLPVILSSSLSGRALPGYSTLDYDHIREIEHVVAEIERYQKDISQKRPLNFLMLASPGAGKSHFIRCIANRLGTHNIGAVTYNMVGLQRHEDLIPPLDSARNYKVEDKLPLLFLDEFDVKDANFPLLLPLLWDGQLSVGQQELKLGKVVIVLAGSDPRLPGAMENARGMKPESPSLTLHHPKLIDLLSRINGGVLRIPALSDPAHSRERSADKICIALQLLRQRFGPELSRVPLALLRFIGKTEFRYGVRSMAHLIDLIPFAKSTAELKLSALKLPLEDATQLKESSLAYHLISDDHAHGVAKGWKDACSTSTLVTIWHEMVEYVEHRAGVGMPLMFILDRLWNEVEESQASSQKPAVARKVRSGTRRKAAPGSSH